MRDDHATGALFDGLFFSLPPSDFPSQLDPSRENAGVKNAAADSKGGKCRSRQSVWKAEPIL